MFLITINGRESDGAYSVIDDDGENILYLFEQEDDAVRYAIMLEDNDYPEMHVIEVDDESVIKTCKIHGYQYVVITQDDIVVPPSSDYDFI